MENSSEREVEFADTSADDATALEDFARLPSTMPDIGIDLYGFCTTEMANSVGREILSALHAFGKVLNLKRLLQVIVAFNYDEALAAVDRGTVVSGPLRGTNDEIAIGIAMTPKVLREGEPGAIMVLNAAHMSVLAEDDNAENAIQRERMLYTLAHECGHVHDLDMQALCFPGTILTTALPYREGILFLVASGCWEEYIACRLSAFMGKGSTLMDFEDTFCKALERAKGRADAGLRQYRMHADVGQVTQQVTHEYKRVMVYASYLLGHLDGLERAVAEAAPKATEVLASHQYFEPFFPRLHNELRALHSTYGGWKGLDVFEPLKQLADELLKVGGIDIQERPEGAGYVNIPITPETTPTKEECDAFRSAREAGRRT